ncbi:MAG: HlyD family efflux transporter periplasmic adaptor subunit [Eubacterium sp.]|nr:HlyD family efflux transporter periplasmic adaptor subunit [Eubacterium sp.]
MSERMDSMDPMEVNDIEIDEIPVKKIKTLKMDDENEEEKSTELTVVERSHELMTGFREYVKKSGEGLTVRKKVVRKVTAILLVILALLTFFSNTIMNYSLPEVSTVTVGKGSVSQKVFCQGTAELSKDVQMVVSGDRVVKEVFFEDGDTVQKGDVIMSFEETEDANLEQAEKELDNMELEYNKSQLRQGSDYSSDEEQIGNAQTELSDAEAALNQARTDAADLKTAKIAQDDAQKKYDDKYIEVSGLQSQVDGYAEKDDKKKSKEYEKMKSDLSKAQEELTALELELNAAKETVVALSEKPSVAAAESALSEKQRSLNSLEKSYEHKKADDSLEEQKHQLDDEKNLKDIEKQKKKIKKLKSVSDFKEIKAKESGIITGLTAKSGDKLAANASVACIQLADSGYEVSCSISKKEAELIKAGEEASVDNIYDKDISASVKSVKADPSDPNQKSIVKFAVKGDIKAGETVQLSVGHKSDKYETVVPKSAVKEGSKGKFIYVVKSKPTPLGNRYIVKQVDVDVKATDTKNSAVAGDVSEYENVVVNSSKPLDDKQQVRLAN